MKKWDSVYIWKFCFRNYSPMFWEYACQCQLINKTYCIFWPAFGCCSLQTQVKFFFCKKCNKSNKNKQIWGNFISSHLQVVVLLSAFQRIYNKLSIYIEYPVDHNFNSSFFMFPCKKCEKAYFSKHLECTVPKCWSKHTTKHMAIGLNIFLKNCLTFGGIYVK